MGNSLDRERYKVAIPQLENKIKTLKTSDLTNDSGFLTNLSGMISISSASFSTGTLGSGGTKTGTTSITKADYYPVGIVGWNPDGSGQSLMNLYNCHLENRQTGSATIDWGVRNLSSSNSYSWTVYVGILWLKVK